jgi:tRNA uridine 5-carboxymethylaminomethyl modification enzyme
MYIQGFSTSMPTDVQYDMLRSLDGFENAEIMRYAYAIEYDSAEPTQMLPTLEFKSISGLYGAGQFNGTSGYEEAAAQGLVAGINAALAVKGDEPMILTRDSSYIGTLVDDLVTKGTSEPYRVMTSRSEYRLLLRQDNADLRLTDIGRRVGLIGDERYEKFLKKKEQIDTEIKRVEKTTVPPSEEVNSFLRANGSTEITTGIKLAELLRRPELTYEALGEIDAARPELPRSVTTTVAIQIKYEGYIKRELAEVERQRKLEEKLLPSDISYSDILGLRLEAAEKLDRIRPMNIGQASRISGVSPADISVLLIYLNGLRKK